jgi:uncharacterized protein YegL
MALSTWGESFPSHIDLVENPEPRCPSVLILDVSASMRGARLNALVEGLAQYRDHLQADTLAAKRVEVAIVTFGGYVEVASECVSAEQFQIPQLEARGDTPMGEAIASGLDVLATRKALYKSTGVGYFRPWVFLLTDGSPTDNWTPQVARVRNGEAKQEFMLFAVGVEGANFDVLRQISVREPLRLDGLRFRDLFQWISASQRSVSHSAPGTAVALGNPVAPGGWALRVSPEESRATEDPRVIRINSRKGASGQMGGVTEPSPVPSRPSGVVVLARCATGGSLYGVRLVGEQGKEWRVEWAFPVEERLAAREGYDRAEISGSFVFGTEWSGCLFCSSQSLLRCVCGALGCWTGTPGVVVCPWCRIRGQSSGPATTIATGPDVS